jgi:hypothetical protein
MNVAEELFHDADFFAEIFFFFSLIIFSRNLPAAREFSGKDCTFILMKYEKKTSCGNQEFPKQHRQLQQVAISKLYRP